MSTIAVNAITDASGGNTASINGATPTTDNTMGRNRIINGAMEIDQRNAGASVTITSAGQYPVDRFRCVSDTSAATLTAQQSSTAPVGFVNSLLWTTSTGSAAGSGDDNLIWQRIEGLNISDLGWGTASAQPITLSFWVRSSLTGTFGVSFRNSGALSYVASYTISAANTWEKKTVTIAGDTSGTWLTTNGVGINVSWDMGCGASRSTTAGSWQAGSYPGLTGGVKVSETSGATFYITGVQLETGSVATSFERRSYGQELQLCQRYFVRDLGNSNNEGLPVQLVGGYTFTNNVYKWITQTLPVEMRATPTVIWYPTYQSTSDPGKARYYTTSQGGTGNILTPYGTNVTQKYIVLKAYNEHNAFTCWGVGAGYDASAEL